MHTLKINVIYPLSSGTIVLRTDLDWNRNIELINREGNKFQFEIRTTKPYVYFKPCVVNLQGFQWSQGHNYLATPSTNQEKFLYPFFFSNFTGTISPIMEFFSPSGKRHLVRIYQPPGYHENFLKHYPTLYMHDGNNIFFKEESFINEEWQVDETLNFLDAMNLIDKILVVAVYPNNRNEEYTAPGNLKYADFLINVLKPQVQQNLRTLTDAKYTAVMGSSLGGLVSMYLAWEFPDEFGMAACLSGTFGFDNDLFQRIYHETKRKIRVYLDSGWPGDNYEVNRSMKNLLLSRGYAFGNDLLYFAFPQHKHNESYWAARCHIPFQFFFGKNFIHF